VLSYWLEPFIGDNFVRLTVSSKFLLEKMLKEKKKEAKEQKQQNKKKTKKSKN
jgi:hypothetical protein